MTEATDIVTNIVNQETNAKITAATYSLFGKKIQENIENISEDIFLIGEGTYLCFVKDAVVKEKDGNYSITIAWSIDSPSTEYHGLPIRDWHPLYLDDEVEFEDLEPQEKRNTKKLKNRLRRGLDFTEQEVNEGSTPPSKMLNRWAYITIKHNKGKEGTDNEGKTFANITDVVSKRLYEEQHGAREAEINDELGL